MLDNAPQVVVADLRCHGESAGLSHALRGPHSLETAANDVIKLLSVLKLFPEMLIGHSFGGKVVLQMTKHWSATARRVPRPVQVPKGGAQGVLAMLAAVAWMLLVCYCVLVSLQERINLVKTAF